MNGIPKTTEEKRLISFLLHGDSRFEVDNIILVYTVVDSYNFEKEK